MPVITETIEDRFSEPERALELSKLLKCRWTEIEESSYDNTEFTTPSGDYRVMTDSEADDAWEEALDSYLEECVYPDLPESLRFYFDDEAWKRDARIDGRGHCLNSYDGSEEDAGDYVVYRTN